MPIHGVAMILMTRHTTKYYKVEWIVLSEKNKSQRAPSQKDVYVLVKKQAVLTSDLNNDNDSPNCIRIFHYK